MDQEITVSKNLVNFLYKNISLFENNIARKCLDILKQNYFVSDVSKIHFNNFDSELNKLPKDKSSIVEELRNFIFSELFKNRIKEFDIIVDESNNLELNLAKRSNDKLILDTDLNLENIDQKRIGNPDLEFHNSNTFTNPECYQRLKNVPSTIILEKDKIYDWQIILSPFFKKAKSIKIKDPFLPNPVALANFKKIIGFINKDIPIKIISLKKEKYVEEKINYKTKEVTSNPILKERYKNFINEISKLKSEGYRILNNEFYIEKSHRERYIYTDIFKIYIPGGLDCLDKDGNPRLDDQDKNDKEIRINLINH